MDTSNLLTHWVSAALLMVMLAITSCTVDRTPTEVEIPVATPTTSERQAANMRARTIRDEFADMAQRIPGGFGGIFFEGGQLTMVLVDIEVDAEAGMALGAEQLIQEKQERPGGGAFNVRDLEVARGEFSYDDLYEWYTALMEVLPIAPRAASIAVRDNRIRIGMRDEDEVLAVERAIEEARVPREAVVVGITSEVQLMDLSGQHRPVLGGLRVSWPHPQEGWVSCSLGPNLERLGQRAFLVNSHCTRAFGEVVDTTFYYQPTSPSGMGWEQIDPPVWQCPENPNGQGCRNSDAALATYHSAVSSTLGAIARPSGRNDFSLNLDSTDPEFDITSTGPWSIDGEVLEKVGHVSGWTGGEVLQGCVDRSVGDAMIICAMTVDAVIIHGDSGGPVFEVDSGTNVELRGTVFGGIEDDEGTLCEPLDPPHDLRLACPVFVASNLGGINEDLQDWHHPLIYY